VTFNAAGFFLGRAIAEREGVTDPDDANRAGLIAALVADDPKLGQLIVEKVASREARETPSQGEIEQARMLAATELERLLLEIRHRHPPR
jgi:hypothetical protein